MVPRSLVVWGSCRSSLLSKDLRGRIEDPNQPVAKISSCMVMFSKKYFCRKNGDLSMPCLTEKHFRMEINDQPSRTWTIQSFHSFSSEKSLFSPSDFARFFLYCNNCVKNDHAKSSISMEVSRKSVSKALVPSLQMKFMGLDDYTKGCMLCTTQLTPLEGIKLPFPPWRHHQACLGGKNQGLVLLRFLSNNSF